MHGTVDNCQSEIMVLLRIDARLKMTFLRGDYTCGFYIFVLAGRFLPSIAMGCVFGARFQCYMENAHRKRASQTRDAGVKSTPKNKFPVNPFGTHVDTEPWRRFLKYFVGSFSI
jgi:hypothetical protein